MVMKRLSYKQQWLGEISQNIMAGILMGLALLPVAIAFSFIVHISPTIGLMSCGLMMLFISFLGERISMVSGPSSGISIVGAPLVEQYNIHYLIMATLIMGIILIIFGMCHIDKIVIIFRYCCYWLYECIGYSITYNANKIYFWYNYCDLFSSNRYISNNLFIFNIYSIYASSAYSYNCGDYSKLFS